MEVTGVYGQMMSENARKLAYNTGRLQAGRQGGTIETKEGSDDHGKIRGNDHFRSNQSLPRVRTVDQSGRSKESTILKPEKTYIMAPSSPDYLTMNLFL